MSAMVIASNALLGTLEKCANIHVMRTFKNAESVQEKQLQK